MAAADDPDDTYLMRLRDDFAQAALMTFSHPDVLMSMNRQAAQFGVSLPQAVARHAYEYADAMLVERRKHR